LADVGYQQGINTQVEVIDAQSALTEASVNYLRAIYQHVVAKLAVDRAMGTIVTTPPAGTTELPKTGDGATKTGADQQIPDSGPSTVPVPEASPKESNG
jgi:hypothetical protein